MLVMWVSVALTQIDRLDSAVATYSAAVSAGLFRDAFEKGKQPAEWRPAYEQATATLTAAEYWQLGAERYFLLHALAQVRKCILALENDVLPVLENMNVLRLLRDIDEHWEQLDGRSLTEMRKSNPDAQPGMLWFNNKHTWIGDADTDQIAAWLASVDDIVRERAATEGRSLASPASLMQFVGSETS